MRIHILFDPQLESGTGIWTGGEKISLNIFLNKSMPNTDLKKN